jgi:hypothetical protein
MRLPGFDASSSLYRTSNHYRIAEGGKNNPGTIGIPPLAAFPVPSPDQPRPEVIASATTKDWPVPLPHVLCQVCQVDLSGQCTKYCVFCPTPYPSEECTAGFFPCASIECCPSGQNPCYLSGESQFCCQPEESCCNPETNFCCAKGYSCCDPENKVCCPPERSCCFGVCCPTGTDCCGGICCPPGQCGCNGLCIDLSNDPSNCGSCGNSCATGAGCIDGQCLCPSGQIDCWGTCVDLSNDPSNCGSCGNSCPTGGVCSNGQCICPVVADPVNCGSGGLQGNSNYFLANNCQPITGLMVSLTATGDIVSSNGFTMQLNADSPQGVDAVQQYSFAINGNSIQAVINNWQNFTTAIVCGYFDIASLTDPSIPVSTPISNGIPNGYTLRIILQYLGTSVSGAVFEVLSDGQLLGTLPLSVSQTGCDCGLPSCPASPHCCAGYQSSADLSPITAFEVNIVGPGGGGSTTFTQGTGNIEYYVSNGTLTVGNDVPPCVESNFCTVEESTAKYGQLLGCPAQSFTQSFST